jgi:hypothetical protein
MQQTFTNPSAGSTEQRCTCGTDHTGIDPRQMDYLRLSMKVVSYRPLSEATGCESRNTR